MSANFCAYAPNVHATMAMIAKVSFFKIYNAVKKVSEERGYQCIFDRASSANIIFASPRIDVSNEVLAKLGYSR